MSEKDPPKSLDDMTEAAMLAEARQYVEMVPTRAVDGRAGLASVNPRRPGHIWEGDVLGLRQYLAEKRELVTRGLLAR